MCSGHLKKRIFAIFEALLMNLVDPNNFSNEFCTKNVEYFDNNGSENEIYGTP